MEANNRTQLIVCSGVKRMEWQMLAFQEAMDDWALSDLGWSRVVYTCDNMQSGRQNVQSHLERAFGNMSLVNKFEHIKVRHIVGMECSKEYTSLHVIFMQASAPKNSSTTWQMIH